MSVDLEPRTRPLSELDFEQEVDFGRYSLIVLARWWLLVVGVIIGALIGLAVAASKSRPYEATAIVYLGQPYLPGNQTPLQSLNTKLAFVSELITSRSTLATVEAKTGIKPGILTSRVSVAPVTGIQRGKIEQPAPLVAVTVSRLPAKQAAAAANAEGDVLQRYFSSYVDQKMATYQKRLARIAARLKSVEANLGQAPTPHTR